MRSNRISLDLIRNLPISASGVRTNVKNVASLRINQSHELVIKTFEPKNLPLVNKSILESQLGYGLQRSTKDESYFCLLPITGEIKEKIKKDIKSMTDDVKKSLRISHQEMKNQIRKDSSLSMDQKKNKEKEVEKIIKEYQERINLLESNKIQLLDK
jgi:ribosome recycling factor